MNKYEQTFTTKLMKWLKYNRAKDNLGSFLGEVKVVRPGSNAFPLKELSPKEERLLLLASLSGLIYKNSDISRLGTYCDITCLSNSHGYLFLHWIKPKNKVFYIIDAKDLLAYRKQWGIKSISTTVAEVIGTKYELK